MRFILKMAWRDSRASRRRLLLFSLSIVLGVAALVAVGSLGANLRRAIDDQARALLGADLEVGARSQPDAKVRALLDSFGGVQAEEIAFASMAVFPASSGGTRLVTVRAVDDAYPFYGDFLTEPAGARPLLADGNHALVEETLLRQFEAKVGDPVTLGGTTFLIAGVIKQVPGDSAAAALLSPRVFVSRKAIDGSGLIGPGSLARYRTYFKLDETVDPDALVETHKETLRELRLRTETVAERKRELGDTLRRVDAFLSLIGFVALFLGGIGVASALHVHIGQKLATVAVMRCLGASVRTSFAVYLVQGLAMGLGGALVGAGVGIAVQQALPGVIAPWLPFAVDWSISWLAVAKGVVSGLAIGGVFTLLPLLAVRQVSPLQALRAGFSEKPAGRDWWRRGVFALIVAAVAGFAMLQTGSVLEGLGFTAALAVCFGVLTLLAKGVVWLARRRLPASLPYVWRQGVANLHRPNNRTVLLLLSLGLGVFFLLTLNLTRDTLIRQFATPEGEVRTNLLFFDIQDDQIGPLSELLRSEGAPVSESAPVVTMRIRSLKGRSVAEVLKDEAVDIPSWTLRREYRSTYRDHLSATEKLLAGELVPTVSPDIDVIPITIERDLAKDMRVGLGDEIEFDVQGVPMRTRIAGIREVEWRRLSPNFFVVFPTGVLEPAPKFFIAAAHTDTPTDSARVQGAVVKAFPNVSAIDLALVLQTLDGIFSKVELVIRFMAFFTVGAGVVVLAGAILTGRFQRIRETVLLRTLGATRAQLRRIELVEYAALGALAAVTGGSLAYGANALLARFVFKLPVQADLMPLGVAILATTVLTVVTGLAAGRGVATHPPLEVLRAES